MVRCYFVRNILLFSSIYTMPICRLHYTLKLYVCLCVHRNESTKIFIFVCIVKIELNWWKRKHQATKSLHFDSSLPACEYVCMRIEKKANKKRSIQHFVRTIKSIISTLSLSTSRCRCRFDIHSLSQQPWQNVYRMFYQDWMKWKHILFSTVWWVVLCFVRLGSISLSA